MNRLSTFVILFLAHVYAFGITERSFGYSINESDTLIYKIQELISQDNPFAAKWLADENSINNKQLERMITNTKSPLIDSTNAADYIGWKEKIKKIKKPIQKKKYIDSLTNLQPQTIDQRYLHALQIAENASLFKKKIKPETLLDALWNDNLKGFEKLNTLLVQQKGYSYLKNKKRLGEINSQIAALEKTYENNEAVFYKETILAQQIIISQTPKEKIITVEKTNKNKDVLFYTIIGILIIVLLFAGIALYKKKEIKSTLNKQATASEKHWLEKENIYQEQLQSTQQQVLQLQQQIEVLKIESLKWKNQHEQFQQRFLDEFDEQMIKVKEQFEEVKKSPGVGEIMALQNTITRLVAWRAQISK